MKHILSLVFAFLILASCSAHAVCLAESSLQEAADNTQTILPLHPSRQLQPLKATGSIVPYGQHWFENKTISEDLSASGGLAYSLCYADNTRFPKKDLLPSGFDAKALLEWGKTPGLNVDILHEHGFAGKGAVIAYIDQPYSRHAQYSKANVHYTNLSENKSSMHGPAVISLLAGKDIGTAPEAEIYYYAHSAWKADQATHSECLYKIIEQNQALPDDQKIRMVGFSDNIDPSEENMELFQEAVKACEDAGVMVWFCGEYGMATYLPFSDRNNPDNVITTSMSADLVYVPNAGRTTAATERGSQYIYWGESGLSWAMPYVLGLYAIAIEIDPALSQDDLRTFIKDTAYVNAKNERIVNPVGFVAAILQGVGRNEEADALLNEAAARSRYLYAVMNPAAMTEADLKAVYRYLSGITDATVLTVDASSCSTAQELYTVLREDAHRRGGVTAGIQIFGTDAMIPSFDIQYKVQMKSGDVHQGGAMLTDLFYSNFSNDPALLGPDYSIMDHLANEWSVDLVPQWPVVRLPLSAGEYSSFIEKYLSFAQQTGLQQLDKVAFYNSIFNMKNPIDDMGRFLSRIRSDMEFTSIKYRLYGNQKGDNPVRSKVLGDFTAENMALENEKGVCEFIVNSHGQWNNIDAVYFENGQEKRISTLNTANIDTVLGANPYYLDTWTCSNGYGMGNNLTTAALSGQCMGMFSCTTIISNNGVRWNASVSEMAKGNFYYFYYHYLRSLHKGKNRSQAFFTAQQEYALALMDDTQRPLRGEGNVQFNLYNLLAYHNFGVIEPDAIAQTYCQSYATPSVTTLAASFSADGASAGNSFLSIKAPNEACVVQNILNINPYCTPVAEAKHITNYSQNNMLAGKAEFTIHGCSFQLLNDSSYRIYIDYTMPAGMNIFIFDPPAGELIKMSCANYTSGGREELVFDLPVHAIESLSILNVSFNFTDQDRLFIYLPIKYLEP